MPAWQGRRVTSAWRKSRRSGDGQNCVEVASGNLSVLVRDSRNPSGAVLAFGPGPWAAFVRRACSDGIG